jgi:hypothetical protein
MMIVCQKTGLFKGNIDNLRVKKANIGFTISNGQDRADGSSLLLALLSFCIIKSKSVENLG